MSAPDELFIVIEPDGALSFIYNDALADLTAEGNATTQRVSDVEPAPGGGWQAAMRGGPVLGPFPLRADALAAEVAWLKEAMVAA